MADSAAENRSDDTALSPSPGGGRNPLAPAGAPESLLAVIERASRDPNVNIEKMQQLFALKERLEAAEAKRAFNAALASAKGEFGPILKKRLVDYPHKDDRGRTSYKHEDFADIATVVDPVLSRYGLSYRYRSNQEGGRVRVTCILSHADGHSEENSLEAIEDKSGQKNAIQAIGSTITYLERYSLKAALGIAAARDDDGAGHDEERFEMGADEIVYVETLVRDTESDLPKFLETIGAPSIPEFDGDQYKRAIGLLNEKKRRAAGGTKK